MPERYYIRGAMRKSGPFEFEFLTEGAQKREMHGIIEAIRADRRYYFLYAEGRDAVLSIDQIDWIKEE